MPIQPTASAIPSVLSSAFLRRRCSGSEQRRLARRLSSLLSRPTTRDHLPFHQCSSSFSSTAAQAQQSSSTFTHIDHPASLSLSSALLTSSSICSIAALPEVAAALPPHLATAAGVAKDQSSNSPSISLPERIASLQRAADIFRQIAAGPNSAECTAVQALLADAFNDAGRYDEAIRLLQSMVPPHSSDGGNNEQEEELILRLALSKAQYNAGWLEEAAASARLVVDADCDALIQGIAMNAHALSRLAAMDYGVEADAVQMAEEAGECAEMLQMATSLLREEIHMTAATDDKVASSMTYAAAASASNEGIAQILNEAMKVRAIGWEGDSGEPLPNIDTNDAIKTWTSGIDILEQNSNSNSIRSPMADMIKSTLHGNIAMAMLRKGFQLPSMATNGTTNAKLSEEDLTAASENANIALKLCDGMISGAGHDAEQVRQSLRLLSGRSLHLVADSFSRAGSAVTAEGLYQSALESVDDDRYAIKGGPGGQIERREIYRSYAVLCDNWEKRSGDADNMRARAVEVEKNDIGRAVGYGAGWNNKPGWFGSGGLWMFTLGGIGWGRLYN